MTLIWSKLLSFGTFTMILIVHFINLATVDDNSDIGTYLRSKSKYSPYFPIIFNMKLVVLTILLFIFHISETIPTYAIPSIQMIYILFIIVTRPHKKALDIVRNIIIEFSLLSVFSIRII